jgi:uncharacterized protein (UPF0335 family)
MTDVTTSGRKIRAFVERIENLDIELQELNESEEGSVCGGQRRRV